MIYRFARYIKRPIGWMLLLILMSLVPVLAQDDAPTILPNLVLSVDGDVYLQRANWTEAVVLRPLTEVYSADIIDATFGEVILKCASGEIKSVTERTTPPCVEIPSDTKGLPGRRAGLPDTTVPYLISPRGKTVNPQPVMRWSPTSGAASYRIDIVSKGASVFGQDAGQKPVATEPTFALTMPLAPGLYSVNIMALNSSGISIGGWVSDNPKTSLEVVTPTEEFQRELQQIQDMDLGSLPGWMRDFLIAETYFTDGFYADAIEQLQPLLAADDVPARVFLKLGSAYNSLELFKEASDVYKQALDIAANDGDLLALAEAHQYLSFIDGDVATQWCHWNEAYSFFARLNDTQEMAALQRQGDRLQKLLGNTPPADCSTHI